jgi:MoaA/NifB/PqqE/SkfB family radical SAM enzyme
MPWIHFHVGDDGIAKACCVANIPFGNINSQSFEEIWNGDKITQLRAKFLKGELDKRCAHCYKLEAAGGKSIRQETFEKFPEVNVFQNPPTLPIYFDIRFSNVCNLKCRTCWHGASSAWFDDAKQLGTTKAEVAVIKNIVDFENFISKLGPSLLQAKEIYLAGGEPLVTEEHYLLLQWLIENKATKIKLRYNTNFTQLGFKKHDVLAYWKHFQSVEILASIDAVGDLGSYIRSGTTWQKVITNHAKIKDLSNISFQISPTISVLNVAKLPQLFQECLDLNMITENDVYINILERPFHYNIQIFPTEKKQIITESFSSFTKSLTSGKAKSQLQEILDYMWAFDHSKHWPKFKIENGKLDEIRNENIPTST